MDVADDNGGRGNCKPETSSCETIEDGIPAKLAVIDRNHVTVGGLVLVPVLCAVIRFIPHDSLVGQSPQRRLAKRLS